MPSDRLPSLWVTDQTPGLARPGTCPTAPCPNQAAARTGDQEAQRWRNFFQNFLKGRETPVSNAGGL